MLSKISSRFPLGTLGLTIFLLILIGLSLTLGLRGTVSPTTIKIVGGSNLPVSIDAESVSGTTGGYVENFSNWVLQTDPSIAVNAFAHNASQLDLAGSLLHASIPVSARLFKSINVNITSLPIFDAQINVSKGVGYGIRFFAKYPNGTGYNVWSEESALDHRPGVGYENLRVNMQRQAFLTTGHQVTTLTSIEIYVEAPPDTTTNFRLDLLSLDFANATLAPLGTSSGLYRATYLDLGSIPYTTATWTLNRINIGVRMTATVGSTYTVYVIAGDAILTSSTAREIPYYASESSSEITFYPSQSIPLFAELLPPWNASIVFVAENGFIQTFSMNYVNLIFLPPQEATPSLVPQSLGFYYSYFILFLFLLPAGVAVLIWQQSFRLQTISRLQIGVALIIGLLCRFALAGVTAHIFDTTNYLVSARAWFQFGNPSGSLGPTLPVTFFLYWMGYSPFALLQTLGFRDITFLGHQTGVFEAIFIKMFPILSDMVAFLFLLRFKNDGKTFVWSAFYFLNPLAIFISAVWGQYEAATVALVVLGTYYLRDNSRTKAAVSFVLSGLLELFGFIPYALLLFAMAWSKKWRSACLLLVPLALAFAYPPETSLIYRLLLAFSSLAPTTTFGSPGKYTLIGSFNLSFVSNFHPLIFVGGALLAGVIYANYLHRFNLNSLVLYSGLMLLSILILSGQIASWLWLLPLGTLYAILKSRDSLAAFILPFGTAISFLIVTHLTGSAYFLLGNVGYPILPVIEAVRNGLEIYTVMVTFLGAMFLYYLLHDSRGVGRTLVVSSALILCVYCLTYFWLGGFFA